MHKYNRDITQRGNHNEGNLKTSAAMEDFIDSLEVIAEQFELPSLTLDTHSFGVPVDQSYLINLVRA